MSIGQADRITQNEVAERLANAMIEVYSTLDGGPEIFTEDVLFDINVPEWRFQIQGPTAFTDWLHHYTQTGYQLDVRRVTPAAGGFVVELEGRYDHAGEKLYFRNLILCQLRDERISEVVFYCTGDWDTETRARHRAEVTLLRP